MDKRAQHATPEALKRCDRCLSTQDLQFIDGYDLCPRDRLLRARQAAAAPAERRVKGPEEYGVTEIGDRCDLCHGPGPVRYLDRDWWACDACARRYVLRLRLKG